MEEVADSLQSQDMYTKQGDYNALYRSTVYTQGQIKRERRLNYTTTFTSWPTFHLDLTSIIDVYQNGVKIELCRTLNSQNATVRYGSKPPFRHFFKYGGTLDNYNYYFVDRLYNNYFGAEVDARQVIYIPAIFYYQVREKVSWLFTFNYNWCKVGYMICINNGSNPYQYYWRTYMPYRYVDGYKVAINSYVILNMIQEK